MLIRTATASDCSAIAELHASSWKFSYRDALSDEYLSGDVVSERRRFWEPRLASSAEHQHVFVAEENDELAGFACVLGDENSQWGSCLNNIHVTQAMQGRRVGASLLHAVARVCENRHSQSGLYLWVVQSNTKAQAFYTRYGARHAESGVWNAPDGTVAPLFLFAWDSPQAICVATANPSGERTS
jgi:GNAT superfamily N-acetyltransferase